MIKSIGELLRAFMEKETNALNAQNVKHPTTIGGMFEDLTADVVKRVIPTNQPLQVVSGFIIKPDGSDSEEMDCMLVTGSPMPIYRSDKVRCKLEDVIAVLQSKKTLTKTTIREGLDNLAAVRSLKPTGGSVKVSAVRRVFQFITGVPLPEDPTVLPPHLEMIYHHIIIAAAYPVCIILSYGGYVTHSGFRDGLVENLEGQVGRGGLGPMSLPDLILNNKFAAIKFVGQPWQSKLDGEWWPLLATSNHVPIANFLLEAIFNKLVLRGFSDPSIFGEDLEEEPATLLASFRFDATKNGWEGQTYKDANCNGDFRQTKKWEPVFLSKAQHDLVVKLCAQDVVVNAPENLGIATADIDYLVKSRLVGRDSGNPNLLRLLTTKCECVCLNDEKYVAGENTTGRLTRWVLRYLEETKMPPT